LVVLLLFVLVLIPVSASSQRERFKRDDGAPKKGDVAPTFTLKTLDGEKEVDIAMKTLDGEKEFDIARLLGRKPIILIFGSYT